MKFLLAFFIFAVSFTAMAVGLIFAKKALRKGCSDNPQSCACRTEGKNPSDCDK
jgi:hypothetical protein